MQLIPLRAHLTRAASTGTVDSESSYTAIPEWLISANGDRFGEWYPDRHAD